MMTHKVTRKCLLVIAACLLVLAMIVSGPILSAVKANSVPSVSIEPSSQTVSPGSSFSIDVVVDSSTYNLKACHAEVSYDSAAFTSGSITEAGLLGTNILIEPGSGITNGVINYGVTRRSGNTPVPVSGTFITIPFTVSDTASPGNYDIDVHDVILKDENNNSVAGVTANDGTIVVSVGPTLESIAASPPSVTLSVGASEELTITATYSDESTADVTAESTYESNDTSVATVSTGLITAVAEGSATITVSYTEAGIEATDTVSVMVTAFDAWNYDEDEDGVMEIDEVLNAISDYFDDEITIANVLEVITLYF